MTTNARLYRPFKIMDKLCFNLVLLAFILVFLQKYAQGIKCHECFNCDHPGVAVNNTCATNGGYCVSTIVREKRNGKDAILVNRGCITKEQNPLCSASDAMKHQQNSRCCTDHDMCNTELPKLAPWPSLPVYKRPTVSDDIIYALKLFMYMAALIGCLIAYVIILQFMAWVCKKFWIHMLSYDKLLGCIAAYITGEVAKAHRYLMPKDILALSDGSSCTADVGILKENPDLDLVLSDLSLKDMKKVVCQDNQRSSIPNRMQSIQSLWMMAWMTMGCWYSNAAARLTTLRIRKTVPELAEHEVV